MTNGDERHGGVGEERQAEAQHAVAAHLQQHAREDDRARRGRLDVGVGQPGVQREHRHLDGEGQEEGEERPELQMVRVDLPAQLLDVEGEPGRRVVLDVVHDDDDGDQHEQAADQREQEELDGRVDASRPAPDTDDEVHRHQHGLPEHVEEEEVGGAEHPRHADLQQQQGDEEAHLALLGVVPAGDDDDDPEQRREEEEQGGDAVDAHAVVDVERLDPGDVLDELHTRRLGVEGEQQDDGERQRGRRDDQRDDLVDDWPAAADEQHEQHAGQGQKRQDAEDRETDLVAPGHVTTPRPRRGRRPGRACPRRWRTRSSGRARSATAAGARRRAPTGARAH